MRDENKDVPWGNAVSRLDFAFGYRFTSFLQAKLPYSLTRTDNAFQPGEHLLARQIISKF